MRSPWIAGPVALGLTLLLLPLAGAEEARVPEWAVAQGSKLQYVYRIHPPNGDVVTQGTEIWEVVAVSDELVTLEMSTDAEDRAHLAGMYTVEIGTRTLREAPSDLFVGNLFWLWIPDAAVGDTVRIWNTDYAVVPAEEEGLIGLRYYEGDASAPRYDSFLYYHAATGTLTSQAQAVEGEPATVLSFQSFEMGSMKRGDFAILTLLSGFTVIEFVVFFLLYRRYRKKIAAHETVAPATHGFCGSCGTPQSEGAFCMGCGKPAAGSVIA